MTSPQIVSAHGFQEAWLAASRILAGDHWEHYDLVVHCKNSGLYDAPFHKAVMKFMRGNGFENPNQVADMVFPHVLYKYGASAEDVFHEHNRSGGYYERIEELANKGGSPLSWGTYFRRLTKYDTEDGTVNQLENVIKAIKSDGGRTYKAAFTMLVQRPGTETVRRRGGPCLNYLAVQLNGRPRVLSLLAVYRNHDFLNKAYGNYMGLCRLIEFLANETRSVPGALTCVSSHAYVPSGKQIFRGFLSDMA